MRRAILAILSASLMLSLPGGTAVALSRSSPHLSKPSTDWYAQFLYRGRNRVNPFETKLGVQSVAGLTNLWTFPTPGAALFAAPIVADGLVIQGEYDCCPSPSAIQALDAGTGALVWTFPTPGPVVVASAAAGGILFAGDYYGTLYALKMRTGKLLWKGSAGDQFFDGSGNNITVAGGVVYTVTKNGPLSAWDASGCGANTCGPLWQGDIGTAGGFPTVGDGMVFVVSKVGGLDAFQASGCGGSQCEPTWTGMDLNGSGAASVVVHGQYVYAGDASSPYVYAYQAAGCGGSQCTSLWKYPLHGAVLSGVAAIAVTSGRVFIGSSSEFAAFHDRCKLGTVCRRIWAGIPHDAEIRLLVANGVIYATFNSGRAILAIDASSGRILWRGAISGTLGAAPTVANGTLYVADTFGDQILAFGLA